MTTGPIKVTFIEIDEETQVAKIKLSDESMEFLRRQYPGLTDQEAINAYWAAATKHISIVDNLKVNE